MVITSKTIRPFVILGVLLQVVACPVIADMSNCRFALHWQPKFSASKTIPFLCDEPSTPTVEPNYSPNWNSTTSTPNPLPCTSYNVTGPRRAGQVYLVIGFAGGEGVAGTSFGIDYTGSGGISPAFVTWTTCADGLIFPTDGGNGDFPKPKGGVQVTWAPGSCAQEVINPAGVHAVVGSFYIYANGPDQLKITPNNNLSSGIPELTVYSCSGQVTNLYQVWPPDIVTYVMGVVGVAGSAGYNPCLVTPIHKSSWGKIKTQYN
jgi:hypothetical protein